MGEPHLAAGVYRGPVAAALLLALCGCAAVVGPAAEGPRPLTASEQAVVAELLRAEDARWAGSSAPGAAAEHESPRVRERAALALGRLRPPEGREPLVRLLADADAGVAATAAFALGQLGDTAAVPHLARLLQPGASAATVAAEAAYALGKLRSPAADSALRHLLATAPLASTGEPVASALLATWRHPRPDDLAPVTRWLGSTDPEIRWRAAYALVRRPTPAAAPLLRVLAADPHPRTRAMAVRGLTAALADSAGIGAAALPLLVGALRDPAYEVRINAARTLGTYEAPESVRALTSLLSSEERHLALVAAESLGRLGRAAAPATHALRELALDAGLQVFLRQTALESLGRVDPAAARSTAEHLSWDAAWRLRVAAARVLAAPAVGARPQAEHLVRDHDPRVAAAALQALAESAGEQLGGMRALLVEALGHSDVGARTAATGALGRLRDPSTFPLLLDAYDRAQLDAENDAALAAIDAIAGFQGTPLAAERAFFGRFPRSADYLVRLRAHERFGAAALAGWGEPLPLDSVTADHLALVMAGQPGSPPRRVRLHTEAGQIELRLHPAEAPLTVENFLSLAGAGYFDGQEWPRVVPNFVVQGGDPRGDTSGGPGYSIRDEINRRRYGTGTLGMALSGPDTGGSQWFITHSPQPHLDGIYTIFGEVVAGQEVTERILPGDRIHTIEVLH